MKNYRIALLAEEINQSYQREIINGISTSAPEFNLDVFAFTSFSGSLNNPKHDAGELNIFNLPDFRRFDGAILLTNTLTNKEVLGNILERIKTAGIPAVSIDNDVPFLYHIGIDNKTAMREITEHMIKKHGCRRLNYISGPKENPESADRLAAFLSVLKENDINIEDEQIYYGDFRAPSGKNAIDKFMENACEKPDAIICANDVMAAAAVNRLITLNYKVPDDIKVTGFDNTYLSNNYQVELTSVARPLMLSGVLACRLLYYHFQHGPQQRSIVLGMSTNFTESCGCTENARTDLSYFKNLNYGNYMKFENSQSFMSYINKFSCDLIGCSSYDEYIEYLKAFCEEIDPEEFYFCLCDNWNRDAFSDETSLKMLVDKAVPTEFTGKIIVPIAYKNGKFYEGDNIDSHDIVPVITDDDTGGKLLYVIPLHSAERCLGYMVLRHTKLSLNNSLFETFCINVSNSLENIRKILCLESAVSRLENLYAQDTFSGIYNRNGFVRATNELYKLCVEKKKNIMLMFIDLDGLKAINDTYGHGTGDIAISSIASVLVKSCVNNEVFCRFGGDEFIVFGSDYSVENAEKLKENIQKNIEKINMTSHNPFMLSASAGYVIKVPNSDEELFDFVTLADQVMYEEKKKKKLSNYLKT